MDKFVNDDCQPINYYIKNLPIVNSICFTITHTVFSLDNYIKLYDDIRQRYLIDEIDFYGYKRLLQHLSNWRERNEK